MSWTFPSTPRYTRGWFSATAETWLALPPDIAAAFRAYVPFMLTHSARAEGLTMAHRIRHGPFPLAYVRAAPRLCCQYKPCSRARLCLACHRCPGMDNLPKLGPSCKSTRRSFCMGQDRAISPCQPSPSTRAQPEADIVWDGLQGDVTVDAGGATSRAPSRALVSNCLVQIQVRHARCRHAPRRLDRAPPYEPQCYLPARLHGGDAPH